MAAGSASTFDVEADRQKHKIESRGDDRPKKKEQKKVTGTEQKKIGRRGGPRRGGIWTRRGKNAFKIKLPTKKLLCAEETETETEREREREKLQGSCVQTKAEKKRAAPPAKAAKKKIIRLLVAVSWDAVSGSFIGRQ